MTTKMTALGQGLLSSTACKSMLTFSDFVQPLVRTVKSLQHNHNFLVPEILGHVPHELGFYGKNRLALRRNRLCCKSLCNRPRKWRLPGLHVVTIFTKRLNKAFLCCALDLHRCSETTVLFHMYLQFGRDIRHLQLGAPGNCDHGSAALRLEVGRVVAHSAYDCWKSAIVTAG